MIIQSGISSPSLTRRVRCFFQNELLTSQLSRRCCAARALMIRLLLNLLTPIFQPISKQCLVQQPKSPSVSACESVHHLEPAVRHEPCHRNRKLPSPTSDLR